MFAKEYFAVTFYDSHPYTIKYEFPKMEKMDGVKRRASGLTVLFKILSREKFVRENRKVTYKCYSCDFE